MNIRKINSQNENDIAKFMEIRKESILDDQNYHNLMTYSEEEKDFCVEGYKRCDFLKNYFVIEKDDKFVGYGAYHNNWPRNFQGNHNFTLGPIYVSPQFRGKGLGKKLLDVIEKDIRENFSHKNINLLLLVNSENHSAISLYQKCHFQEVGKYQNYIQTKEGKYFDVIIMQKKMV